MRPHPAWLAAAFSLLCVAAAPAFAQGKGYGVGEWYLSSGGSVCRVVLTEQYLPNLSAYRAYTRPDGRCTDWRVRNLYIWVVRGNDLKLVDKNMQDVASLGEQGPNLYASGGWELRRIGSHYPGPGNPPQRERPGQGYGLGEWNLVNQANGSVCHVTLTNRLVPEANAYRAISRGGQRCHDRQGQSLALWVVRGNTMLLVDSASREVGRLNEVSPNEYAGGNLLLRRSGVR